MIIGETWEMKYEPAIHDSLVIICPCHYKIMMENCALKEFIAEFTEETFLDINSHKEPKEICKFSEHFCDYR